MKTTFFTLASVFACFAGLSAVAAPVPCGPRYQPDLSAPAGSVEISFSSVMAGEVYSLDRSEMFTSALTTGSAFPRMSFHAKEQITPGQNGQSNQSSLNWVCADLYPNTPALNSNLLYLGSMTPALDGSIYSNFRRYQLNWPDQGVLSTKIINDTTMNPYGSATEALAREWQQIHLFRLADGGLCLTLTQPANGTSSWASAVRVFLKKVQ